MCQGGLSGCLISDAFLQECVTLSTPVCQRLGNTFVLLFMLIVCFSSAHSLLLSPVAMLKLDMNIFFSINKKSLQTSATDLMLQKKNPSPPS